jgi:AcrR family transcriptional regulator
MNDAVKPQAARGRGRPRNPEVREAILRAARSLLTDGGPGAVTMEAVAERAGVGKPTVYRWWPDRHAVTMAALMEGDAAPAVVSGKGSEIARLRAQLRAIAARFGTPTGRHIASMIAASEQESELAKAFRGHFVMARREEGRLILKAAVAQQELRPGLDLDAVLDSLYGALFFRLLMGHAPLDANFVDTLVKQGLRGLAPAATSVARRRAPSK